MNEPKTPEEQIAEKAAAEQAVVESNKPIQSDAALDFVDEYLKEAKSDDKAAAGKGTRGEKLKSEPDERREDRREAPPLPKKKARRPAPEPIDYEKLATATGEGVAKAIAASKPAPPEPPPQPEIDPADEERIKVLRHMETLNPTAYKGLADKFVSKQKELQDYAQKWETDNPGEEFDEEAPEHEDFLNRVNSEIDYEEDHYTRAMADMIANEKVSKVEAELAAERAEKERGREIQRRKPDLDKARDTAGNHFWDQLGEDFKGVVKEDGTLDMEKLKEIEQTKPEHFEHAAAASNEVERLAQDSYLLANNLIHYVGDQKITEQTEPEEAMQIQRHAYLNKFAMEREKDMLAMDPESQLDDRGRQFLPKSKYVALPKAKKDDYWTFSSDDFGRMLAARLAANAQARIQAAEERFQRVAKARGLAVGNGGSRRQAAQPQPRAQRQPPPEEEVDRRGGKPRTPTVSPESRMASRAHKGGGGPKTPLETFVDDAIG